MILTGFEANRAQLFNSKLSKYRIIHFATHVVIDGDSLNRSGIVLSLINRHGNHQNRFVRFRDIYSLHLPADLVVLSACQSNLGRYTPGGGLVGLTHGFIYAGSKSVVGSLWKVDDRATEELMEHFYRALLSEGKTPAAALRAAKTAMWESRQWGAPFYLGWFRPAG